MHDISRHIRNLPEQPWALLISFLFIAPGLVIALPVQAEQDGTSAGKIKAPQAFNLKQQHLQAQINLEQLEATFQPGKPFLKEMLPSPPAGAEDAWLQIPHWMAGTWHKEFPGRRGPQIAATSLDVQLGDRCDGSGEIWQYVGKLPRIHTRDRAGCREYIITYGETIESNPQSAKRTTANLEIDVSASGQILRTMRTTFKDTYKTKGQDVLTKSYDALADHIRQSEVVRQPQPLLETRGKYTLALGRPYKQDSLNGAGLQASLNRYLQLHEQGKHTVATTVAGKL